MIFAKNKEGVREIRALKYKKRCGRKIYSRTRALGAKVRKSYIQVKKWYKKDEIIHYIERHITFVETICLISPTVRHYRLIQ